MRDCRIKARSCRRSSMALRVCNPCFSAFLLPRGAPDPGAPPCMRQRLFPLTAGDMHGLPDRVLAPQRGLDSIGPVLRECSPVIYFDLRCAGIRTRALSSSMIGMGAVLASVSAGGEAATFSGAVSRGD